MEISTTAEDKTNKAAIQIGLLYQEIHSFPLMMFMGGMDFISKAEAKQALKGAGFISHKRRWTAGQMLQ